MIGKFIHKIIETIMILICIMMVPFLKIIDMIVKIENKKEKPKKKTEKFK